jgi:thiamine-phosphate pyrophosphorylase
MANLAEQARRLNRGKRTGFALLTDDKRMPDPLPLLPLLPPGSLVVLRHYDAPDRAALARALARACRARRLIFVVAGDFDLALAIGAGLHLPEHRVRAVAPRIRLWHRRGKPLSAAAHGRGALVRAATIGVDFAVLSPVFPTASHPGAAALGRLRFRSLARGARVPVWALGGVTVETMRRLRDGGASGVATVGNLTR